MLLFFSPTIALKEKYNNIISMHCASNNNKKQQKNFNYAKYHKETFDIERERKL